MNGCGACEHFKAAWNSYVANNKNQCAIAVERQDNPSRHGMNLSEHQKKISAFPTIMLIDRNGTPLGEKVGVIDENTLDAFVNSSGGN
jgi:thioredoxin-related protein